MTTPTPPSPSSQVASLKRDRSICGGDGCGAPPETWPLHNVRQRGVLLRLCTSCVLKNNPGLFCSACFLFLDAFTSTSVVHCSSCPSLCHRSCLLPPHRESGKFLCPNCENRDGFSYFSNKEIDVEASKVLVAAARIAAASMGKAVAAARAEAERKVREAVAAKKRAREMLDRAAIVAKLERERKKAKMITSAEGKVPESKVEEKKVGVSTATMMAEKRLQNREREKMMKFQPFQGVISTAPLGSSAKNGLLSVDRKKILGAEEKKGGVGNRDSRILDCTNTNTNTNTNAAAAAAVKPQQLPPNTIS